MKLKLRLTFWVLFGLEDDRLANAYLIWILDTFNTGESDMSKRLLEQP